MPAPFKRDDRQTTFSGSAQEYKDRCFTFLDILCNEKDFERASGYIAPDCVLVHEDNEPVHGAENFIGVWKATLEKMPRYTKEINDIMLEVSPNKQGGARVWVYSTITGITDAVRDSIAGPVPQRAFRLILE